MNPLEARSLAPPRPNPGPEPWPGHARAGMRTWLGVAVVVAVVVGWFWFRRTRGRRSPREGTIRTRGSGQSASESLLELAVSVRGALGARPGPSWPARTTEEIAADQPLRESLGDEMFESLVAFLLMVDTLKFAPSASSSDAERLAADFAKWSRWAIDLERSLKARANGKARHSTASARSSGTASGRRTT